MNLSKYIYVSLFAIFIFLAGLAVGIGIWFFSEDSNNDVTTTSVTSSVENTSLSSTNETPDSSWSMFTIDTENGQSQYTHGAGDWYENQLTQAEKNGYQLPGD